MKKSFSVIFIFLAFVMSMTFLPKIQTKGIVYADSAVDKISEEEFKSRSVYLIDAFSGEVIVKKNELEHLPIASMCKIMTLLLTFENIDNGNIKFEDEITISDNASSMGGSQIFLESNGLYKVKELVKGITVASANDASVAMAETIAGSESSFVDLMNKKAKELGMNDTYFVNCTGLPKPEQYSCAKDVSVMFRELIKHKDYFKFSSIWMDNIKHPKDRGTDISNTNKLIKFYPGCDCGKTGYTSEAGHCLVASAMRNGLRFIGVVISAPDSKTRFKEVSDMFNYGFANYCNKLIIDKDKPLNLTVEVVGGKQNTVSAVAENSFFLFSKRNVTRSVEFDFKVKNKIKAPVKRGEVIGELYIYENNMEIAKINILANEDIQNATFTDNIKSIIKNWALI